MKNLRRMGSKVGDFGDLENEQLPIELKLEKSDIINDPVTNIGIPRRYNWCY